MPQYAVLIYNGDSAHRPDRTPEDTGTETCDRHADELTGSGVMALAFALEPRAGAYAIRDTGVTEGPYLGAAPIVAGFYVIDAPDLDAALKIAGTNPAIHEGGGVEVRPVDGGFIRPA